MSLNTFASLECLVGTLTARDVALVAPIIMIRGTAAKA